MVHAVVHAWKRANEGIDDAARTIQKATRTRASSRWLRAGTYSIDLVRTWQRLQNSKALCSDSDSVAAQLARSRASLGQAGGLQLIQNAATSRGVLEAVSSGHVGYLDKLRSGLQAHRSAARQHQANKAFRMIKREQQQAAISVSTGSVVVERDIVEAEVHYSRQGDLSMSTLESLAQRAALRQDPLIIGELHRWWEAAMHSVQHSKARSGQVLSAATSGPKGCALTSDAMQNAMSQELDKQGYMVMMRRVYRHLMDDYDEGEIDQSICDDWEQDCRGAGILAMENFMDAHFELCDTWTRTIDAHEYKRWLEDLFQATTMLIDGRYYVWRDLSECSYGGDSLGLDWVGNGYTSQDSQRTGMGAGNGPGDKAPSANAHSRGGKASALASTGRGHSKAHGDSTDATGEIPIIKSKGKGEGRKANKKRCEQRIKAAVLIQSGIRRKMSMSEALAAKSAAFTITRLVRARRRRKALAAEAARARLAGDPSPWNTPGRAGVKQRWALRTGTNLRPREDTRISTRGRRRDGKSDEVHQVVAVSQDGIAVFHHSPLIRHTSISPLKKPLPPACVSSKDLSPTTMSPTRALPTLLPSTSMPTLPAVTPANKSTHPAGLHEAGAAAMRALDGVTTQFMPTRSPPTRRFGMEAHPVLQFVPSPDTLDVMGEQKGVAHRSMMQATLWKPPRPKSVSPVPVPASTRREASLSPTRSSPTHKAPKRSSPRRRFGREASPAVQFVLSHDLQGAMDEQKVVAHTSHANLRRPPRPRSVSPIPVPATLFTSSADDVAGGGPTPAISIATEHCLGPITGEELTFAAVPIRSAVLSTYSTDTSRRHVPQSTTLAHVAWNFTTRKHLLPRSSSEPRFFPAISKTQTPKTSPVQRLVNPSSMPTVNDVNMFDQLKAAFVKDKLCVTGVGADVGTPFDGGGEASGSAATGIYDERLEQQARTAPSLMTTLATNHLSGEFSIGSPSVGWLRWIQ